MADADPTARGDALAWEILPSAIRATTRTTTSRRAP